jgi:hypothetical protein
LDPSAEMHNNSRMKLLKILIAADIILTTLLLHSGCNREDFQDSPAARLAFSDDTVTFDTIFTSLGSTTRQLKIYNPYNKILRVSSVLLEGGETSPFQINIDGMHGPGAENLELLPHDSLYIFIQITIDPNASNAPLLVEDRLLFVTNGNTQPVILEAWGQDVHLINGEVLQSQTWTGEKPYLVYDWMLVDSGQTLTIESGTRIFLHRGTDFVVNGTLLVNGTLENPVIFQGDRLEEDYWDIPGQWNALAFGPSSNGNKLIYTTIQNGVVIQVGAVDDERSVDLQLENCRIMNMTFAGIYAFGAQITGVNVLAANAGDMLLGLFKGGTYRFYHSTFYNQGVYFAGRSLPSIIMTNYAVDENETYHYGELKNTFFGNCIVWGTMENELGFSEQPAGGSMDYFFDHCLLRLRSADINIADQNHYDSVWYLSVPDFKEVGKWDFTLDTLSFAKDKGAVSLGAQYPLDYYGKSRVSDIKPDLGAFERVEAIQGRKKK